jgi:hypothetical protein
MTMTKREQMIQNYSSKPGATVEIHKGATIISYTSSINKPCVAIYTPFCKGIKPAYNYAFNTDAERADFIADEKRVIDRDTESAELRAAAYAAEADKIQTGSIMYSSWGYEQTNIDFFKVLSRKNNTVTMQKIGSKVVSYNNNHMSGQKVADESVVDGEVMTKRINKFGGITLNSFAFCGIWDGRPLSFSEYA